MALSYSDALDYLYSLINYEVQRPERYAPEVVSLERPRALLAALGNPQERYPCLHLTGTKGKGSVSAMCASVLSAAGLRVGLYSSPHLQDFRERIRLNDALIAPELLASLVERVQPYVARLAGLTWFEVVTAIAFMAFAEVSVDVAVIEVGLGGRLDATNILRAPLTTTVTSLSYDHTHLLGNTLPQIAFEKAGIFKRGVPAISAPQPLEALAVLERIAAERNAPLIVVGRDVPFEVGQGDEFGQTFRLMEGAWRGEYWTPLLGAHQALNGAVALATLEQAHKAGLPISRQAIHSGLAQVNWAGRLEVVRRAPYLLLDSAHNAASAERLRDSLQSLFLNSTERRLILIFGAFSDKDVSGMFRALLPLADQLILMQPISPRAFSTDQLAELALQAGYTGTLHSCPSAQEALARAEQLAAPSDVICATGSLSVVGELRSVLGLKPGRAAYLDERAVQLRQNRLV
ncbi:MAG: bifunctional folylpolyglutamate synthase/dihydrofolate synthase [Chloroflexota bacterium]|nr:MAG: bifunctional folylpolyglutamate synthase/dihydrofolate synthase [Chloroflexota bacterium]